jgi:hypothetical protein
MTDSVQKVARAPFTAFAREEVRVAIDGIVQLVMVERQERPRGGWQAYWHCPVCDRRCCHLFVLGGALACRVCHGLDYRSRHTLNPALIRAAKLRRKLGAAPGLLSAIPKRPPRWRRDYWARTLRELARTEDVIAQMLSATLRAAKRQKVRLDG